MQRICRQCRSSFEITPSDLAFYEKVSPVFAGKREAIPPPTLCPECRSQRRLSFRNERHLYRRVSDMTGKPIVSIHVPDAPFPVYEPEVWYGDDWDPLEYGVTFDFSRPFFEQYHALQRRVPRLSLAVVNNENCPYVNQVWNCKNCHLSFDMGFCEDVFQSSATYHSKDATDCTCTRDAVLAYELVDCSKCYHAVRLLDCTECHDAFFSIDCGQCNHIAFCHNLRGKQHCLFNEQFTKEAWERAFARLQLHSAARWEEHEKTFLSLMPKTLRKATHNVQCEDCTGDYLLHSRRCRSCFNGDKCEDLKYCNRLDERVSTAMDLDHASIAEIAYEGLTISGHHNLFCHGSYSPTNSNMLYCDTFVSCSDCFGCIGIRNKKHCILNRQYSKEEYERLVPQIIDHMRKTVEWGEFFPASISFYAYNQSVAQEDFPLSKEEVIRNGWRWYEEAQELPQASRVIPASQLPDSIAAIPDDIISWAIECDVTKRPFKIIKQELEFYRRMGLPVPRLHPDERHRRRMALRNPRKLWKRECAKCGKEIQTTYAPDRPEIVYCEGCYLRAR